MSPPRVTAPAITYGIFLFLGILAAGLHLTTVLITGLFAYLALQNLSFCRYKWVSVGVFLVLLALFFYGFAFFVRQAIVELPEIVSTSVPRIVKYATSRGIDLPFTDVEGLKTLAIDSAHQTAGYLGSFARLATKEFLFLVVGVVVAIGVFVTSGGKSEDADLTPRNLYTLHVTRLAGLFHSFYISFRRVMGAQVIISAINTILTGAFVYTAGLPYATVVIIFTFLCGMLPVVGNLVSNALIVGLGFTISPQFAGWALLFLVVIHKLEYFLNSRIIGGRIRHPMWLTLLALLVGERLMGIAGIILAPVILNFIRNEASKYQLPAEPDDQFPKAP